MHALLAHHLRRRSMLWLVAVLFIGVGFTAMAASRERFEKPQPAQSYQELRTAAERFYDEGSYRRALEFYRDADKLDLDTAQQRWVDFRLGDTLWRSQAATSTRDESVYEDAQKRLAKVISTIEDPDERDEIRALAQRSMGDFHWLRENRRDWGSAWQHYAQALDWWSGVPDVEQARRKYLDIVWDITAPENNNWGWSYALYQIPMDVLENARQIARDDVDRSRAHYILALSLKQRGGSWWQQKRIAEQFEAALQFGEGNPWYDDALYHYAEWLAQTGVPVYTSQGWRNEPDYVRAVELFRKLVSEFDRSSSQFHDNAKYWINEITSKRLAVSVSNVFVPGSEIELQLAWRNVSDFELLLYPVDLTEHLSIPERDHLATWIHAVSTDGIEPAARVWIDTKDTGIHRPGQKRVRLEEPLPAGAFIALARSGDTTARELVLVSDMAIVLKADPEQALAFICDALTGAPIADASLMFWQTAHLPNHYETSSKSGRSDANGLATFAITRRTHNTNDLLLVATAGKRQAFAMVSTYWHHENEDAWRCYVFTDRPAYRPEDTVRWKLIARQHEQSGYRTPDGAKLKYRIVDPRGSAIDEGTLTLNAFGSAWGEIALSPSMPLGEFRIEFRREDNAIIGGDRLFRLEEYKLPEFEVAVNVPEDDAGRKRIYRPGEPVTVEIKADYYFGGPVAGAQVEAVVRRTPYYRIFRKQHEYPWFYDDQNSYGRDWYGGGEVVVQRTIATDENGVATLTFDSEAGTGQDYEYTVEARVTDASRREIAGSGAVRVTQQRYYVHLEPDHRLHQPDDEVEIEITALDANDQPLSVEGEVLVTREIWEEIWIDPWGRDVSGEDLRNAKREFVNFPPPPLPGQNPWRLKFRGYRSEDIEQKTLTTNDGGKATLTFTPKETGFYRIRWRSEDEGAPPITSETAVHVVDDATKHLGYHANGIDIVVDEQTLKLGAVAPVMITTERPDSWVLFTVEGRRLHHHELVHVEGNVHLIHLDVSDNLVPNVTLGALTANRAELSVDQENVVIPPIDRFLNVSIEADAEAHEPGEEGTFKITVTDQNGNPARAEIAFSVFDESITYIQQEYAGDPREFFYQQRQAHNVQTASTFSHRRYVKLVEDQPVEDDGPAMNERVLRDALREDRRAAGTGGGILGDPGGDPNRLVDAWGEREESAQYQLGMPTQTASRDRSVAAQAPAPMAKAQGGRADEDDARDQAAGEIAPQDDVQVRSDFSSTLLWRPDATTDEDGVALITLTYNDALTRWKAVARAATADSAFGRGDALTRTRKPLIARLQAPRFFIVGDEVTISGVFNNNTDEPMTVRPQLEAQGLTLASGGDEPRSIDVPANGEARVDWRFITEESGDAVLRLIARAGEHRDAMEKTYPVHAHGIEKFLAVAGKIREAEVVAIIDLPKRRKGSTEFTVQITPSVAVTMLDALPYLIDYPYGCTEQTMSRFMPLVITARTLQDVGFDIEDVLAKSFGGIEQQHLDATHPEHQKERNRAKLMQEIANANLQRLYDFQHGDGGWGWWKDGESDLFMTSYVLWGLALAHEAELDVKVDVMERAAHFLGQRLVEGEFQPELQAWMLHALGTYSALVDANVAEQPRQKAIENLWAKRDRLNAYGKALFALALHHFGEGDKAQVLVRNLENGVALDEAPDTSILIKGDAAGPATMETAHWGAAQASWRWSEQPVETTAMVLRALMAIEPKHELVEPTMNWLVKNRRGAQWSNTRDTALAVLALNDYLQESGELRNDASYELFVNGERIAQQSLSPAQVLGAPSRFVIDDELLRDGRNEVRIVRSGEGSLYFAAHASFFSMEEPITAAGSEIFVRRDYYKLTPRETLLKGFVYDRALMRDGDYITSGERVEVVLTIETKNDLEYLVFEDFKPAGFESVQVRSGESAYARELKSNAVNKKFGGDALPGEPARHPGVRPHEDFTGASRWLHQEMRDTLVASFADRLPQGVWEIRYDLRAEVPGAFHALPTLGHAMYVPEVRANSDEVRVQVNDREEREERK